MNVPCALRLQHHAGAGEASTVIRFPLAMSRHRLSRSRINPMSPTKSVTRLASADSWSFLRCSKSPRIRTSPLPAAVACLSPHSNLNTCACSPLVTLISIWKVLPDLRLRFRQVNHCTHWNGSPGVPTAPPTLAGTPSKKLPLTVSTCPRRSGWGRPGSAAGRKKNGEGSRPKKALKACPRW
jgi:hypothetical protein